MRLSRSLLFSFIVLRFELDDVGGRIYTEVCCLSSEKVILICTATDENGWKDAHLMINGHRFCDDFVGYKAMMSLDVQGNGWSN